MFFKILKINLFVFFLFSISFAEIIKEIKVTGNKRLSKDAITIFADIEIGKDYNENDLNTVLKRLYNSNFLKDVDLKISNNILQIDVIENPIIESIVINGVKNEKLKEAIYENFKLKNRQSYIENSFKNDSNSVQNFLKQLGYYFSSVKTSISKNNELNSVVLNYDITLGDKAKISEIKFIGNKQFKDRKLKNIITSEVHQFWKFISRTTVLDSNRIDLDKRLLENYFKNSGFYNVKVLNSFVETQDDNSFKLIFNIESGEKFYFNKVSIKLPDDFEPKYFDSIKDKASKSTDKHYSLDRITKILNEVDKIALTKQYEFIDAVIDETIVSNNKIDFVISMKESEKSYVEKINILGNQYTKEEVLRNSFIVDEGDPFNELLFTKSIDKIKSKGLFKNVTTRVKDGSNSNLKQIDIIVEEKPTGEITLGAGVGTSGGTIGGGIKEKNFLGSGITLNTNLSLSEETVKGEFSIEKPNFKYSDNTLFASAKSSNTDKLADFGYESSDIELSLGTEFQQFENFYFRPIISAEVEKLDTTSNASAALKKQDGDYFDTYFKYIINYDLRDRRFQTRDGYQVRFYQDLPVVSDTNEIINTLDYSTYHSFSDIIGRFSFFAKAANSLTDDDVRISKRLYMPGRKLRGFERGKVGPIDNKDFIGGNYLTALNFSATMPKLLPTFQNTDVKVFMDMANVWGVDYSSSVDESNKIRSSVGIAMEVISVVGPMTFSLAQPVSKLDTDQTETFRFNIGTTF